MALDSAEGKRTASAKTVAPSRLILIPKETYLEMTATVQKMELPQLNIPMFDLLSEIDQYRFCRRAQKRPYSFQQQVYRLGDAPTEVYYIISGEFKRVGPRGIPLGYIEAGSVFGDDEVIDPSLRKHSVVCHSTSGLLYVFKKESF